MESADYGDSFAVEGDPIDSQNHGMATGTSQRSEYSTPAGPFRRFTLPRYFYLYVLLNKLLSEHYSSKHMFP